MFEKLYGAAWQQASASPAGARIFAAATENPIDWSKAMGGASAGSSAGPALRLRHALFGHLVYGKLRAAAGGRVLYAVSGGAPLGERLGHFFRGCGMTVLEGYGLTEASGAATVNRPGRCKIGTVGQPLPGVTARIAGDGEILLRGPNVFPGYWHGQAAPAGVRDHEGWLHSGDIGTLDEDGFLRVTGRKKELIITAGGTNVAPEPLEDRLRSHWLVSQCMVAGEGRPCIACLVTLDRRRWSPGSGSTSGPPAPLPLTWSPTPG